MLQVMAQAMAATMPLADDAVQALDEVVDRLVGGEHRQGQQEMVRIVSEAIESHSHAVIQAGTGIGKTLAYLIPAVLSGRRTVIATATKALQDQLANKDLPFLAEHLGVDIDFAVLKGRSNYLCLQRLDEAQADFEKRLTGFGQASVAPNGEAASSADSRNSRTPGSADSPTSGTPRATDSRNSGTRRATDSPTSGTPRTADSLTGGTLKAVARFAARSRSGDREHLGVNLSNQHWRMLSVSSDDCPGALRCPRGRDCFTERARERAALADVVVVNLHLYALAVRFRGILNDHDLVVIDEAHEFEDIVSAAFGRRLSPNRFKALARRGRTLRADQDVWRAVQEVSSLLTDELRPWAGRRLDDSGLALANILAVASRRVSLLRENLVAKLAETTAEDEAKVQRVLHSSESLLDDINALRSPDDNDIVWVEHISNGAALRTTPLRIDEMLAEHLWQERAAILTSATIPLGQRERVGLPETSTTTDLGSPFDYQHNALLYCPPRLPAPSWKGHDSRRLGELETLITAAEGRTLALFTSYAAMNAAAQAMKRRLRWPILVQNTKSKSALLKEFTADEHSSLFATISFWQGIDVPGRSCSLVVIDKLPFPRPDDPVLEARRELANGEGFAFVDLPRAATRLTQGAGRLIRTAHDQGVVAVLDSRLVNRRYGESLLQMLPPMRRTGNRGAVVDFLHAVTRS